MCSSERLGLRNVAVGVAGRQAWPGLGRTLRPHDPALDLQVARRLEGMIPLVALSLPPIPVAGDALVYLRLDGFIGIEAEEEVVNENWWLVCVRLLLPEVDKQVESPRLLDGLGLDDAVVHGRLLWLDGRLRHQRLGFDDDRLGLRHLRPPSSPECSESPQPWHRRSPPRPL